MEALCVAGGETLISESVWRKKWGEAVWTQAVSEKSDLKQGKCEYPVSCPFASECTRKIMFIPAITGGFSKAIVHTIIFPNSKIPKRIAKEDEGNFVRFF